VLLDADPDARKCSQRGEQVAEGDQHTCLDMSYENLAYLGKNCRRNFQPLRCVTGGLNSSASSCRCLPRLVLKFDAKEFYGTQGYLWLERIGRELLPRRSPLCLVRPDEARASSEAQ